MTNSVQISLNISLKMTSQKLFANSTLFNGIKEHFHIPIYILLENITTIFKRGSRFDMNNDRGIFILTVLYIVKMIFQGIKIHYGNHKGDYLKRKFIIPYEKVLLQFWTAVGRLKCFSLLIYIRFYISTLIYI